MHQFLWSLFDQTLSHKQSIIKFLSEAFSINLPNLFSQSSMLPQDPADYSVFWQSLPEQVNKHHPRSQSFRGFLTMTHNELQVLSLKTCIQLTHLPAMQCLFQLSIFLRPIDNVFKNTSLKHTSCMPTDLFSNLRALQIIPQRLQATKRSRAPCSPSRDNVKLALTIHSVDFNQTHLTNFSYAFELCTLEFRILHVFCQLSHQPAMRRLSSMSIPQVSKPF